MVDEREEDEYIENLTKDENWPWASLGEFLRPSDGVHCGLCRTELVPHQGAMACPECEINRG